MARRTGLGRGLGALIPGSDDEFSETGYATLPIENISSNPRQPRTDLNLEDLQDLASSIKEHGILQPLVVSRDVNPNQYTLVAGERRLRAAKLAGLEFVPVVIRQVTDQDQLELALIENIQRENLNPLEMAAAYSKLIEEFGLSHEVVAQRVGKSRVSVTNTIRLLKLPEVIKTALLEGKISEGHARSLLSLSSTQIQIAVLANIIDKDLSVRQTEILIQSINHKKPAHDQTKEIFSSPEVISLEERLRTFFGTKVDLQQGKKGGKLVIHYYSDEELNSIMDQILGEKD
jgi:ParB family transcriptional regulator, chromosome partitioning protein